MSSDMIHDITFGHYLIQKTCTIWLEKGLIVVVDFSHWRISIYSLLKGKKKKEHSKTPLITKLQSFEGLYLLMSKGPNSLEWEDLLSLPTCYQYLIYIHHCLMGKLPTALVIPNQLTNWVTNGIRYPY